MMNALQLKLCDIQGRLFELSAKEHYGSADFVKKFMNSRTAKALDSTYNRMQWAGEEYLLEEVCAETGGKFDKPEDLYEADVLYWMGYVYRYWHYYTGESSAQIYRQASAETLRYNYLMFHTMDPSLAIEELKEIYRQKRTIPAERSY